MTSDCVLSPAGRVVPMPTGVCFRLPGNIVRTVATTVGSKRRRQMSFTGGRVCRGPSQVGTVTRFIIGQLLSLICKGVHNAKGTVLTIDSVPVTVRCYGVVHQLVTRGATSKAFTGCSSTPITVICSSGRGCRGYSSVGNNIARSGIVSGFGATGGKLVVIISGLRAKFSRPGLRALFLSGRVHSVGTVRAVSHMGHGTGCGRRYRVVSFSFNGIGRGGVQSTFTGFYNVIVASFSPLHRGTVVRRLCQRLLTRPVCVG